MEKSWREEEKNVCICFLYNFGMNSGFTAGSRGREAEDAVLIHFSCLERAIFSPAL